MKKPMQTTEYKAALRELRGKSKTPEKEPPSSGPERRLVCLVEEWRSKADHCEAEIARSKKKKPTLHLSTAGRICYEQAARTLRQCADLLESEANSQDRQP